MADQRPEREWPYLGRRASALSLKDKSPEIRDPTTSINRMDAFQDERRDNRIILSSRGDSSRFSGYSFQSAHSSAGSSMFSFRTARSHLSTDLRQGYMNGWLAGNLETPFRRMLREHSLLRSTIEEHNWSGRGEHVEFETGDLVPLDPIKTLGHSNTALVDAVQCRRIMLARKTMVLNRKVTLKSVFNEVQHLQRLRHVHMVQLVGTYLQGRKISILMYPVAEYNLADFMESCYWEPSRGRLVEDVGLRLLSLQRFSTCLSNALSFIHANNVEHMDIKPKNILIRRASPVTVFAPFQVYLCDFGLSRDFSFKVESQTTAIPGMSAIYASPEVSEYSRHGRPSDIFSLGCVFLEIATTLVGLSLDEFAEFRAGSASGDESFQANLISVELWSFKIEGCERRGLMLEDVPPDANDPSPPFVVMETIRRMLSRTPNARPTAAELQRPCSCCDRPAEAFEEAVAFEPGETGRSTMQP